MVTNKKNMDGEDPGPFCKNSFRRVCFPTRMAHEPRLSNQVGAAKRGHGEPLRDRPISQFLWVPHLKLDLVLLVKRPIPTRSAYRQQTKKNMLYFLVFLKLNLNNGCEIIGHAFGKKYIFHRISSPGLKKKPWISPTELPKGSNPPEFL